MRQSSSDVGVVLVAPRKLNAVLHPVCRRRVHLVDCRFAVLVGLLCCWAMSPTQCAVAATVASAPAHVSERRAAARMQVSGGTAAGTTAPLVTMGPCSATQLDGPVCAHVVRCPAAGWYALRGRCYQACPSNAQHRDSTGRCLCGKVVPNVNCSAGLHCGSDHRCGGPVPTIHTVQLGPEPSRCNDCSPKASCGWPEFEYNQIRDIGDHSNPPDGASEFAVPFCQRNNPALAIVDVVALKVIGLARSPVESNRTGGVILYPGDGEKIFPVLAPGYGEGTASCGDPAGHCGLMWYFLCAYTPDLAEHPTTNCTTFGASVAAPCHCGGNHFAAVSILPNVKPWGNTPELLPTAQPPIHGLGLGLFREDGGYVSHVDSDRVEDGKCTVSTT